MKVFLAVLSLSLVCLVAAQRGGEGRSGGHSNERGRPSGRGSHSREQGGRGRHGGPPGRNSHSHSRERFGGGRPRLPFPSGPGFIPAPSPCRQCFAIRNGCTGAGCVSPSIRYIEEHEGSCMMAVVDCPGNGSTQLLTEFGFPLANGFGVDAVASCVNGQWQATDQTQVRRSFTTLRCMASFGK